MASKPGLLETDLDQCSYVDNDSSMTAGHPQPTPDDDLETAIVQTASSFATIKESLHNLLEKMRLNRMDTPRKCPPTPARTDGPLVSAVEDDRRSAVPWWSSESSCECDSDSDDSGFQFGPDNRKYVMDHSGSSETSEGSVWDTGFGCEETTAVPRAVDRCPMTGGGALPGNTHSKYRAREVLAGKGQLKVALYINSGLLTVHVEKAKKLESKKSKLCNSYVRIEVIPKPSKRPNCRTLLVKSDNCPLFDQKFSFELTSSNESKRVFISVWHRDLYRRNSEFLGCMSFGIAHVTKHPVHGWYRLMTNKLGKNKHFEVKSDGRISSILRKVGFYSSSANLSRPDSKENLLPAAAKYFSVQRGIVPSHQHHHNQHHNHVHSRPSCAPNGSSEHGVTIRVRAQIECWGTNGKCGENHAAPRRSSTILKSKENTVSTDSNEMKIQVDRPRTLGSLELFMDASMEEDRQETKSLTAEMKYPSDRVWFIDEVTGNCLANL